MVPHCPFMLHRIFDKWARYPIRELSDLAAMQILAPLSHHYVPWNPIAMRPAGIVAILNDICVNERSTIVECGGGISTLYIARLLAQLGRGRVQTVEHHAGWAAQLQSQLEMEGLEEQVSIVVAELVPTTMTLDGRQGWWYDAGALETVTRCGTIDLLVVDGPPGGPGARALARYPAVPFFNGYLGDSYTIVLDDIYRRGEQTILEAWEALLDIRFERRFAGGRVALGRSKESFQV